MSASLILRYGTMIGNPLGNLGMRCVNITGTPVVGTPTILTNGAAMADVYTVTFLTSTSATVSANAKNPYTVTVTGLVIDGVTPNLNLIPGFSIILSASCVAGWQFKFTSGAYMDGSAVVTDVLDFGVVQSGTNTNGIRCVCENVGDAIAQQCKLYALPGSRLYGSNYATLIQSLLPHSSIARHKMASPALKTITFVNWGTDAGSGKKKADIQVGGVTAIVGALFDGLTIYEYGSNNGYNDASDLLVGQSLVLANTVVDPTASTVYDQITDGYAWVEFAPEVSPGTPGTFAQQDLTLTESGQNDGDVLPSGGAYFYVRSNLPSGATAGLMRSVFIKAMGLTT